MEKCSATCIRNTCYLIGLFPFFLTGIMVFNGYSNCRGSDKYHNSTSTDLLSGNNSNVTGAFTRDEYFTTEATTNKPNYTICVLRDIGKYFVPPLATFMILFLGLKFYCYTVQCRDRKKEKAQLKLAIKDLPLREPKHLTEAVSKMVQQTWKYDTRQGRDAVSLYHIKLKVKRVYYVNNKTLMEEYRHERERTYNVEQIGLPFELRDKPILTSTVLDGEMKRKDSEKAEKGNLKLELNEAYLFHGTKLENVANIIKEGFDVTKSNAGLYGKGIYLAESSEKADQYTDYHNSRRDYQLVMFLVRVNLGKVHCLKDATEIKNIANSDENQFDTVVAGFNKRFREFLVFNAKRLCPEYMIVYDRIYEADVCTY